MRLVNVEVLGVCVSKCRSYGCRVEPMSKLCFWRFVSVEVMVLESIPMWKLVFVGAVSVEVLIVWVTEWRRCSWCVQLVSK